jgi:formylglycine-generating enzyme required for sulfatase activity
VGCGGAGSGRSTLPVGSFAPSDYGLYDLVGNVWEWVADCESNVGRPSCPQGLVRGGAFTTRRNIAVLLPKGELDSGTRDSNIGFRIVRELTGAPAGGQPWCTEVAGAP